MVINVPAVFNDQRAELLSQGLGILWICSSASVKYNADKTFLHGYCFSLTGPDKHPNTMRSNVAK